MVSHEIVLFSAFFGRFRMRNEEFQLIAFTFNAASGQQRRDEREKKEEENWFDSIRWKVQSNVRIAFTL